MTRITFSCLVIKLPKSSQIFCVVFQLRDVIYDSISFWHKIWIKLQETPTCFLFFVLCFCRKCRINASNSPMSFLCRQCRKSFCLIYMIPMKTSRKYRQEKKFFYLRAFFRRSQWQMTFSLFYNLRNGKFKQAKIIFLVCDFNADTFNEGRENSRKLYLCFFGCDRNKNVSKVLRPFFPLTHFDVAPFSYTYDKNAINFQSQFSFNLIFSRDRFSSWFWVPKFVLRLYWIDFAWKANWVIALINETTEKKVKNSRR